MRLNRQSETHTSRVPNYASRWVQYRLLALVFATLFVFFVAGEAAKPENWRWMFGQATVPESDATATEDASIDTRLSPKPQGPQPPGVVIIKPNTSAAMTAGNDDLFLGIDPERYQSVKDDTVFRGPESELWYELLAGLRAEPSTTKGEIPLVGFTQLYRQPEHYRGRLVRVAGTVKRAHVVTARENNYDIQSYWQCWLFPAGTTNPIVVYALDLPSGFPTGMSINEATEFRGVFFKRWAYDAAGGIMAAPLILAGQGEWTPAVRPPAKSPPSRLAVLLAVALAAVFGTSYACWVYQQSLRIGRVRRLAEMEAGDSATTSFDFLPAEVPPTTDAAAANGDAS